MKNKTNSPFLNYVLTIGFVAFLIVLLATIVVISRFVLSDVNPLGQHVQNTKDLLNDVNEVQKAAEQKIENQTKTTPAAIVIQEVKTPEFNTIGAKVTGIHHMNVNENKSILTIFFDHDIYIQNGIYYFKIKDLSELHNRELVLYRENTDLKTGQFMAVNQDGDIIIQDDKENSVKINEMDLLGKIFYIEE